MEEAVEAGLEGQGAALSLERYAEVVAHLLHFKKAKPFEVLERLGVDAGDWESAEKTWSRAMGDELARQETTLTRRFADALAGPQQRLAEARPALESIGPLAPERAPEPEPAAPASHDGAASEAPPAPEATEPVPIAAPSVVEVPTYALPAPPAPATPPPAVIPALPVVVKAPAALTGTALTLDVPRGPAMPFSAPPVPPPPLLVAAPGPPVVVKAPAALTGTALTLDVPRGPAVPFTAPPAPAAPPPAFTLEQYASLSVELETYGAHAGEVLTRYRLTAADKAALDRHFQAAFAQHPDDWQAFQRARESYRAWLAASRPKG